MASEIQMAQDTTLAEGVISFHSMTREVLRLEADGRVFWNGREVESDETFRAAMMELHQEFVVKARLR